MINVYEPSRYEFEKMVMNYGCGGKNFVENYNELTEGQKEILDEAWHEAQQIEKEKGNPNEEDYCDEAYEAAGSWHTIFIIKGRQGN